jgi:hypothetical protein
LEAKLEQEFDEIDKMFARAAEGVMIMVAPAEAELVLTVFLYLACAIAVLPVGALGCEEKFARKIATDKFEALVDDFDCDAEAVSIVGEKAGTSLPQFFGFNDGAELVEIERGRNESAVGMAFDGFEPSAIFFGEDSAAIAREGFAFNLCRKIMSGDEIGDEFRMESDN